MAPAASWDQALYGTPWWHVTDNFSNCCCLCPDNFVVETDDGEDISKGGAFRG